TGYNWFALALPVPIVAPIYLRGDAEFGVISQAQRAFATVLAAFSLIITQFERISTYSPGIKRLGELGDNLYDFDAEADRVDGELDQIADWAIMLSLGEQQRVSFARLFLKKPIIAFLDEATSALDEPNEKDLYSKMRAAKMSYLSVGHRSTLKEFHDWLII